MKKFLCLILVLLLSVSVFTACGNNAKDTENSEKIVLQNETDEEAKESELPIKEDPSKKDTTEKFEIEEDTKNDNAQDFYLISNGTNEENISYHTKNCPLLKDNEIQKTSWEMISMLEFRHCSKCNPPKYEGYVE